MQKHGDFSQYRSELFYTSFRSSYVRTSVSNVMIFLFCPSYFLLSYLLDFLETIGPRSNRLNVIFMCMRNVPKISTFTWTLTNYYHYIARLCVCVCVCVCVFVCVCVCLESGFFTSWSSFTNRNHQYLPNILREIIPPFMDWS